jgi:hypothetical protein
MAKFDLLEQTEITVGEHTYTVTAMTATEGLKFLEDNNDVLDSGKSDVAIMRRIICKTATLGSMAIDEKKFDKHFARKYKQMRKLYVEILKFNFPEDEEGFQEPDTED